MAGWQILEDNPKRATGSWEILDQPQIPGMEKLGPLPGPAAPRPDIQPESLGHPAMRMAKDVGAGIAKVATTPIAQSLNDTLGIDRQAPTMTELYDSGLEGLNSAAGNVVDKVAGAGTYSRMKQDFGGKVAAVNEIPRAAMGLLDFSTTPTGAAVGVAGPALAAASPAVRAAVPAAFSTSMAPEAIESAKTAYEDPSEQNIARAAIGAGMTVAPLFAHPAARKPGKPIVDATTPETTRRPATPEAVQAMARIETDPTKLADLRQQAAEESVSLPERQPAQSPAAASAAALEQAPDYAALFDQADRGGHLRRGAPEKPVIPEEGIPENVARAVDSRDRIAMQVTGKPFEELSNSERIAVDDLIAEGYTGAGGKSEPAPVQETPVPEPATRQDITPQKQGSPGGHPARRARTWEVLPDEPVSGNANDQAANPVRPAEAQRGQQDLNAAEQPAEAQKAQADTAQPAVEQPEVRPARKPLPEGVRIIHVAGDNGEIMVAAVRPGAANPMEFISNSYDARTLAPELAKQGLTIKDVIGVADIVPPESDAPGVLNSMGTSVADAWQRQGIGSAMYDYAEGVTGKKMIPAPVQTSEGAAFVKAYRRQPEAPRAEPSIPEAKRDVAPEVAQLPAGPSPIERNGLAPDTSIQPAAPPSAAPNSQGLLSDIWKDETGALQIGRTPKPLTPAEQYAEELATKREEARGKPGLVDKAKGLYSQAKTKLIDFNAPIEDLLSKAKKAGAKIDPKNDIEHQIDMSLRSPMLAGQFIKDHGFHDLLKDVDNPEYVGQYMTAKQAKTVEAGGHATGRDAVRDQALIDEFKGRVAIPATKTSPAVTYEQVSQKVNQFSRSLLDYAVDAGMINADLAKKLKQIYPEYVPLKRVFEVSEEMNNHGTGTGHASLSSQSLVQRLEGSKREIENPLDSILDQVASTFAQGEKNKAGKILAGYGATIPEFKAVITEVTGDTGTHPHTFSFLDNGKKRTFETTPEIAAAAKALNVQQMNVWGRILAAPVRLAKVGITGINLPFVGANIARDQGMAAVTSGKAATLNPKVFMKALTGALGHGDLYQEMVRNGAGGTSFDIARNAPGQNIAQIRSNRSVGSRIAYIARNPSELLRAAEDIVGRSEELTRLQQYEGTKQAYLKEGRTPEDAQILAAKAARSNTANFSRRGEWGTVLNSTVLYLNAGIQGSRSHIRALGERPISTTAKIAGTILLPVATATLWNLSDPERAKAYKDIEKYEKENGLIIVPPNPTQDERGRWNVIKIPMAAGLVQLGSPIRRAIEQMHGMDPVKTSEVANSLISAVSPIDPEQNKILSSLTPQAIRPTLESYSNTDFFTGMPVVPDRMKELPPAQQVHPYTSGTARKIAGMAGKSPISTEHWIKGTFGGVGSQALHAADEALASAGAIPKNQVGGESIPEAVAARFTKARGGAQSRQQFADIKAIDQEHAGKVAEKKNRSREIFAELQSMNPDEVASHLTQLAEKGELDEKGFADLAKMATERAAKLTPFERSLAHKPTEVRAKFAIQQLRKTKPEEREKLMTDWAERGIINEKVLSEVAQQLQIQ